MAELANGLLLVQDFGGTWKSFFFSFFFLTLEPIVPTLMSQLWSSSDLRMGQAERGLGRYLDTLDVTAV